MAAETEKLYPVFAGLDVGTSGTKICFFDETLSCISAGYSAYETVTLPNGGSEQDPEDWLRSTAEAIKKASAGLDLSRLAGLGISTQAGSTTAVGADMKPLIPAMTWMDKRSAEELKELTDIFGRDNYYHTTGWRLSAYSDTAKFRWLMKHSPELFPKVAYFLSTPEYVTYRLTGELAIDVTNGALRHIVNMNTLDYDDRMLEVCGMTRDKLPPIIATGAPVGKITESASREFGLPAGLPVFCAAHDQYCAALGGGAVDPGDMILATGTAWVLFAVSETPIYGGASPAPHPAGGYGAIASYAGGSILKWYRGITGEDYASLDRGAALCRETAKDLFMPPYLEGRDFPVKDNFATATFYGLKTGHTKYDLALAVMEGVAFETKSIIGILEKEGFPVRHDTPLTITGGAADSELWSSVISAVLDRPLAHTLAPQPCCSGAAVLAAAGTGMMSLREASTAASKLTEPVHPDPDAVEFYREKYKKYKELA